MKRLSDSLEQYLIDYPAKRGGRPLRDAGTRQIVWAGTFGILLLFSIAFQQPLFSLGFAFVMLGALPGEYGPLYSYPGAYWSDFKIKRRQGNLFGADVVRKRRNQPVIPRQLTNIMGVFATVYDPVAETDTVYFKVDGWQYANEDVPLRAVMQRRVDDALKTAIAQTELDIAYAFINGQRPTDPTHWALDVNDNYIHSDVAEPIDDVSERLRRNIDLVFQDMVTNEHASYIGLFAVVVKRPESWKQYVKHPEKFSAKQLRRSSLYRVLTALQDGLIAAGFIDLQLMDYDALHRYVYQSWNVTGVDLAVLQAGGSSGYYQSDEVGNTVLDKNDRPVPIVVPFPMDSIKVIDKKILQIDGSNLHRMVVVSKFGRTKGLPGSAYPLIAGPYLPWVMHAVTCNTTSQQVEKWFLRKQRQFSLTARKTGLGTLFEEQEDRDKAQAEANAVDTLYRSNTKAIRTNHYYLVSSNDREELDERYDELISALRKQSVRVKDVKRSSRLIPAFLAVTLGPSL